MTYWSKERAGHLAPVPAPTNANEPIVGTVPLAGQAEHQPAAQAVPGGAQGPAGYPRQGSPANAAPAGQQATQQPQFWPPAAPPSSRPTQRAARGWTTEQDDLTDAEKRPLSFPQGAAELIAEYLYGAAPRPLVEAAVAGTLGLLAGINGRAYTVSQPATGLNLYVLLVASSAMGKEAIHRIQILIDKACERAPVLHPARRFVVSSNPVSEAALTRELSENPGQVNLLDEVGRKLLEMSRATTLSPLYGLRTMLTALWEKSGPDSRIGGRSYSKKETNIPDICSPGYSILGDGTPGNVYDALNASAAEDGFLSRFTIVDCPRTERPQRNEQVEVVPSAELLELVQRMLWVSLGHQEDRIALTTDLRAQRILAAFDEECDKWITKAGKDESRRALWTRAVMKVYRVAGNLAVADHWHSNEPGRGPLPGRATAAPEIQAEHVKWAIALERRNIAALQGRLDRGDAGDGDDAREKKLLAIVKKYIQRGPTPSYIDKIPAGMVDEGIITRSYLANQTSNVSAFKSHKAGANMALDLAIRALVDNGYLMEEDKKNLAEDFGFRGRCFRFMQLP